MHMRSYKFRLYPSRKQEEKLMRTLEKCRFTYNMMLDALNNQDKPDRLELQALLPVMKEAYPELKDVYSKTLQYESYRLFSNLRALAQLKKRGKKIGRLRFKGREWFKTFTYKQSGFKITEHDIRFDTLHLSKIDDIPFIMHRKMEGEIKQLTIKRMPSNRWFVCVTAEIKEEIRTTQNNNINYHIVWIPKYRRPVLIGNVKGRLGEIINQTAEDKGLEILAMEIQPDHIHLFVSSPPKNSPALIVNWFKGISARKYNHLFKPRIKWTRAYYVGTAGTVTAKTIKKYIEEQTNASRKND